MAKTKQKAPQPAAPKAPDPTPERTPEEQAMVDDLQSCPRTMKPPKFKAGAKPGDVVPDTNDGKLWAARVTKAVGIRDSDVNSRLLVQAAGCFRGGDGVENINLALAALHAIGPQDATESFLATQMLACHQSAMECYRRAMLPDQTFEGRDLNLRHAAKLSRLYADQIQALSKYRNRGQQTVRVEHVTVNGNAIVGTVHASPGGGATIETGEQAHALAIEHAPVAPMLCPDPLREAVPVACGQG